MTKVCGRYYIDFSLTDEIEEVVHSNSRRHLLEIQQLIGDILPTNAADSGAGAVGRLV